MTNIEKSSERTSTGIVYKTAKTYNHGKNRIKVKIRLDDECGNKRPEFAITADVYESTNGRPAWIMGGCCHEEILKAFPEFARFVKLHLSGTNGAPLYAVENGLYHFKTSTEKGAEYFRISPADPRAKLFRAAALAEDKNLFSYYISISGILEDWRKEAAAAVAFLEELSGLKFENPYKPDEERAHFKPLAPEMMRDIAEKIAAGYYSAEALEERRTKIETEKRAKVRADIVQRFEKICKDAQREKEILLFIFDNFGTIENVIFYKHSQEIELNWMGSNRNKVWTDDERNEMTRLLSSKNIAVRLKA